MSNKIRDSIEDLKLISNLFVIMSVINLVMIGFNVAFVVMWVVL